MCGISGVANLVRETSLSGYYAAHLRLRHRGRDDEGFFVARGDTGEFYRGDDTIPELGTLSHIRTAEAANVVLGYRRLSIIDLSPGGHQPMSSPDRRYTMVYNGEIFNYIELRRELRRLGHRFHTQSDTEVLLAAFSEWNTDCFTRLNGMWALAIYDAQERKLILSRDRFGIKPLFYSLVGGTLYFGSEAKVLLPFLPTLKMNEARVIEYLVENVTDHHAETMFDGVYQVLPAHYVALDRAGLRDYTYWQLPERKLDIGLTEAIEQLDELLTSAVALRLRSDVPIGSSLSGGLDSTTIVCIVRRLLEDQAASNTFDFFSAVFHEQEFSERRYIEDTVAQTGLPIHWIYPAPRRLATTLPQILYHQEFPFRSLAVYSQWEIMRHVSQTPIVVLLNGQGSDEIFAGYTAHYYALAAEYLRRLRPGRAQRLLNAFVRARRVSKWRAWAAVLNLLLRPAPRCRPVPYLKQHRYCSPDGWSRQKDIFRDALVRNLTFSALPEYLRYEDRNSMAFTLESRLPFMDYRLVEWAMSLPARLKIEGTSTKHVLREMARPLIPQSVTDRQDKMGFVSPQERWQREILAPMLDDVFESDLQATFPFLAGEKVKEMYWTYRAGRSDQWSWVWRMACLFWWHRYWWKE